MNAGNNISVNHNSLIMERSTGKPIEHHMLRKAARRIAYGNYILFGIAGSSLALKLKVKELAKIEAYYGRKAELVKEAEMLYAMNSLGIKQVALNAAEQAQLEELDRLEEEKLAESETRSPRSTPSPVQDVYFCTNCGKRVNTSARFCDSCGTQLFF